MALLFFLQREGEGRSLQLTMDCWKFCPRLTLSVVAAFWLRKRGYRVPHIAVKFSRGSYQGNNLINYPLRIHFLELIYRRCRQCGSGFWNLCFVWIQNCRTLLQLWISPDFYGDILTPATADLSTRAAWFSVSDFWRHFMRPAFDTWHSCYFHTAAQESMSTGKNIFGPVSFLGEGTPQKFFFTEQILNLNCFWK